MSTKTMYTFDSHKFNSPFRQDRFHRLSLYTKPPTQSTPLRGEPTCAATPLGVSLVQMVSQILWSRNMFERFPTLMVLRIGSPGMGLKKSAYFQKLPLVAVFRPVEIKKPPVEIEYLPVEIKNLPVEIKYLPVEIKNLPVEIKYLPVGIEFLPVEIEYLPVGIENLPVEIEYLPVDLFPVRFEEDDGNAKGFYRFININ
ncbi:MAG: hypothetical protein GY950_30895 [bacterium]|nr:hypothetical protein [bacterium]